MAFKEAFNTAAKKTGAFFSRLSRIFFGAPTEQLGPTAKDPALHGSSTRDVLFDGAKKTQPLLTIDGSALKAGHKYFFSGGLRIKGDVPDKTRITVEDGFLDISGNVGHGSKISVDLPVRTHEERYTYTTFMMVGKVMIPMTHTGTRTVVDGLLHENDKRPSVTIRGRAGNDVRITANGGIDAAGWGTDFKAKTGYNRPLRQISSPKPAPYTVPTRRAH